MEKKKFLLSILSILSGVIGIAIVWYFGNWKIAGGVFIMIFGSNVMLEVQRMEGQQNEKTDPEPTQSTDNKIFKAVDRFAIRMKTRLAVKIAKGFTGWDDTNVIPTNELINRALDKVLKLNGQLIRGEKLSHKHIVDLGNFAMMLNSRYPEDPKNDRR